MLQYFVWLLTPCFLLAQTEIFHKHVITTTYDKQERPLSILISDIGEIRYDYSMEEGKIYRFSPTGELLYSSPYTPNVVIAEHPPAAERSTQEVYYDNQGNLIQKGETRFIYDAAHRLIAAQSPDGELSFAYDHLGRRVSKTVSGITEYYLYSGMCELGIFTEGGALKELRIPGLSFHKEIVRPVVLETPTAIYRTILDAQCNIAKLVNIETEEEILTQPALFGQNLINTPTAWVFSSKHYDPELNLIYFGHRYYDPSLRQWLTPDPLAINNTDLYTYCFNDPLHYIDPDGRWAFVIPLIWEGGSFIAAVVSAATTAVIAWGAEKIGHALHDKQEQKRQEEFDRQHRIHQDRIEHERAIQQMERNKENQKSAKELQQQIEKDQAPDSIDRADAGEGPYEKDHVHFKDKHALNDDGTWKHKGRELTNKEKKWLQDNGWTLPKN